MVQVISGSNSLSWSHAVGSNYGTFHPWSFLWWPACQTAPAENHLPLISSHAAAMSSCNNGVCRSSNGKSVGEIHEMLVDLELQCDKAPHESWEVLGQYMHKYANRIFRQHGQDDLSRVRELVCSRFNELWLSFIHEYLPRPTTCHISVAKHYAETVLVDPSSVTMLVAGRGTQVSLEASSHDAVPCRIDEVAAPAQNSVMGAWHYAETQHQRWCRLGFYQQHTTRTTTRKLQRPNGGDAN